MNSFFINPVPPSFMNELQLHTAANKAIALLRELVAIPSLSKQENKTADLLETFIISENIPAQRSGNNVFCVSKYYDASKPTILLNSHHDTVPANAGYTNDPHQAFITAGKLFGLGTTDAGASLVSLLMSFLHFYDQENLAYNIVFAASAEEEISGQNGIAALFADENFKTYFKHQDSFAIVGEPTQLDLAIAEKGLLVVDCTVTGVAGHAAREEGENAIYKAIKDLEWIRNYRFEKSSAFLGDTKMTVTIINTNNSAHNVIPAACNYTIDIRVNELYTHEAVIAILKDNLLAEIKPRSTRLRSSFIDAEHPVVKAGVHLGKKIYGSPTLSDKALIPLPALKCGPGNSAQSHSANEYVEVAKIENGIDFYTKLLQILINSGKV